MNTKLDFEGRQRVSVLVEQIGDDLDEYAWRLVEQEAEIVRLEAEVQRLKAKNARLCRLAELFRLREHMAEIERLKDEVDLLRAHSEAWKEVAEYKYGQLRIARYGEDESGYPVQGALDAWAQKRHPILLQAALAGKETT